jgi:hypothetical protein
VACDDDRGAAASVGGGDGGGGYDDGDFGDETRVDDGGDGGGDDGDEARGGSVATTGEGEASGGSVATTGEGEASGGSVATTGGGRRRRGGGGCVEEAEEKIAGWSKEWEWHARSATRTTSRCSGRPRRIGGVSDSALATEWPSVVQPYGAAHDGYSLSKSIYDLRTSTRALIRVRRASLGPQGRVPPGVHGEAR